MSATVGVTGPPQRDQPSDVDGAAGAEEAVDDPLEDVPFDDVEVAAAAVSPDGFDPVDSEDPDDPDVPDSAEPPFPEDRESVR